MSELSEQIADDGTVEDGVEDIYLKSNDNVLSILFLDVAQADSIFSWTAIQLEGVSPCHAAPLAGGGARAQSRHEKAGRRVPESGQGHRP